MVRRGLTRACTTSHFTPVSSARNGGVNSTASNTDPNRLRSPSPKRAIGYPVLRMNAKLPAPNNAMTGMLT